MVLDENKNIIMSTEENMDLVNVLDEVYFNSNQEASFQKENFEYMFYKSDYNNFIYISKIPYRFGVSGEFIYYDVQHSLCNYSIHYNQYLFK